MTTPVIDMMEEAATASRDLGTNSDLLLPELSDAYSPYSESRRLSGATVVAAATAAAVAAGSYLGSSGATSGVETASFSSGSGMMSYLGRRRSSDDMTLRGGVAGGRGEGGGGTTGGSSDETFHSHEEGAYPMTGNVFSSPLTVAENLVKELTEGK